LFAQNRLPAAAQEQWAASRHSTHLFWLVSQTGPATPVPLQSVDCAHWTQAPVDEQAGALPFVFALHPPPRAVESLQATHVCWLLHRGLPEVLQSEWALHSTHVFVAVLQTAPGQSVSIAHWTHFPLTELQAGETPAVLVLHSAAGAAAPPQPTHRFSTHSGRAGSTVQLALVAHSTQRPVLLSQVADPPARRVQALSSVHLAQT
jgi:hypothetical protein